MPARRGNRLQLPGVILASKLWGKTECGARQSRWAARAIPFALLLLLALFFGNRAEALEPDDPNAVIAQFLKATKIQQDALRGMQMEVEIDAQLPKLKENGKLRVLKVIPRLGEIVYHKLGEFVGDRTVENEVIARYLELDKGSENPENASSMAITPENYHFRLKTKIMALTPGDSKIYVFELKPKRKAIGLFKGELWLDAATGMPVRESGALVKMPSIALKSLTFENEFEIKNGVAWPTHVICHVDTHVAGRADLNVRFSNVAPAAEPDEPKDVADVP